MLYCIRLKLACRDDGLNHHTLVVRTARNRRREYFRWLDCLKTSIPANGSDLLYEWRWQFFVGSRDSKKAANFAIEVQMRFGVEISRRLRAEPARIRTFSCWKLLRMSELRDVHRLEPRTKARSRRARQPKTPKLTAPSARPYGSFLISGAEKLRMSPVRCR